MSFDNWLNEIESYSLRVERLFEELADNDVDKYKLIIKWLESAYEQGKNDERKDVNEYW
jgi:hypothetical protein